MIKKTYFFLTFTMLLCLMGCGRYKGQNGYYFAWSDYGKIYISLIDTNKDGEITTDEIRIFKKDWLSKRNWTKRTGDYQIYDRASGRKISAFQFAQEFTKEQSKS